MTSANMIWSQRFSVGSISCLRFKGLFNLLLVFGVDAPPMFGFFFRGILEILVHQLTAKEHPVLVQGVADDGPAITQAEHQGNSLAPIVLGILLDHLTTASQQGRATPGFQDHIAADGLRVAGHLLALNGGPDRGKGMPLVFDHADLGLSLADAVGFHVDCSSWETKPARDPQSHAACAYASQTRVL